jgi:dienelactone hydrolase
MCALLAGSPSPHTYDRGILRFKDTNRMAIAFHAKSVATRDGVRVYDITYASGTKGVVPAYVVVPFGKGPFASVVFAHWAMEGSPTRNRTEFLNEAIVLAHAGAISLLPDAPFARPGAKEDSNPIGAKSISMFYQQVLDLKRGLDVLRARKDIDRTRIGFVGHSYDANAGGVLTGANQGIKTFVLMSGGLSDIEGMDAEFCKQVGNAAVDSYIRNYWWLDPALYIPHAAPASVLLQYGNHDPLIDVKSARHYFDMVSEPKEIKFYDAGHALDAAARRDRMEWLVEKLGLRPLTQSEITSIPETK